MNENRRFRKSKKIGDYHYFKGNYNRAIENYFRAIRKKEDDENIFLDISYCFEKLNNIDLSLEFVDISLIMSSFYDKSLEQKIYLLNILGRKDEAEEIEKKLNKMINDSKKINLDNLYKK